MGNNNAVVRALYNNVRFASRTEANTEVTAAFSRPSFNAMTRGCLSLRTGGDDETSIPLEDRRTERTRESSKVAKEGNSVTGDGTAASHGGKAEWDGEARNGSEDGRSGHSRVCL